MGTPPHPYHSDQLNNLHKFAERASQQLNAKKEKVKTLTDAENLLEEEQKFCRVVKASIEKLSSYDQLACYPFVLELKALGTDAQIVEKHRKRYREERVVNLINLSKIEKYESILKPRPNFKVRGV